MSLTKIAVKNRVLVLFICVLSVFASLFAYKNLGKLEDPSFTIKLAKVVTSYPGASPEQVETEVTEVIEESILELASIRTLRSTSRSGLSILTIEIKPEYSSEELPQVWDELRRKVRDVEDKMPLGASQTIIADDFGDVFGMLFAISGEGLGYEDLTNTARDIQKYIKTVDGVTRVVVWGSQRNNIVVEFKQPEVVALGLSMADIHKSIAQQSVVENAGDVSILGESVSVLPSGRFQTPEDVGNIRIANTKTGATVALKDIARVYEDLQDPLSKSLYIDGKPALAIAISASPTRNIIEIGKDVENLVTNVRAELPLGLEIEKIYWQPDAVQSSVSGFMINFLQSFLIVFAVLLVSMGVRNSALVTIALLLNICFTFVLMYIFNINIHRISLGALIISLGMLVDNAIVVVQGVEYGRNKGLNFLKAIDATIRQSAMPLLGATLIAVLAFSPIGLSNDGTGEINFSLFQVVGLSLLSSWLIAVFALPIIGGWFFGGKAKPNDNKEEDKESIEYVLKNSLFLRIYDKILSAVLSQKIAFLLVCFGVLVNAMQTSKIVSKQFFPDSNLSMFTIDVWYPKGIDIRENVVQSNKISSYIQSLENVEQVTVWAGGSSPRFILPLYTEDDGADYSSIIVKVNNLQNMHAVLEQTITHIKANFPDVMPRAAPIAVGPRGDSSVEVRFYGKDPAVLESLANQAVAIMEQNGALEQIRTGWRNKVKVLKPMYDEEKAKKVGVTYADLADALRYNFNGLTLGYINRGYNVIPIVSKPVAEEYNNIDWAKNIYVQSSKTGRYMPIENVVSSVDIDVVQSSVLKEDRLPYISVLSQHTYGGAIDRFLEVKDEIEAIHLPPGYGLKWYGEYEKSSRAMAGLKIGFLPALTVMTLLILMLFNSIRQLVLIYVATPFMAIGIFYGLFISNNPLNFVAILAIISLIGIFIKNAIVLIDEFNIQVKICKGNVRQAVRAASVLRVKPVALTALTTIFGMVPLTRDVFFESMAYVIMFGLLFSVFLSSFLLPVLLSVFYGKKHKY